MKKWLYTYIYGELLGSRVLNIGIAIWNFFAKISRYTLSVYNITINFICLGYFFLYIFLYLKCVCLYIYSSIICCSTGLLVYLFAHQPINRYTIYIYIYFFLDNFKLTLISPVVQNIMVLMFGNMTIILVSIYTTPPDQWHSFSYYYYYYMITQ